MPGPSTVKQLLQIPFVKGLSQREAAQWLEPGALLTAQNTIHPKTNIVSKRPGSSLLAKSGILPGGATFGSLSVILTQGIRLFSRRGALGIIGRDNWTDAAWSYDEAGAQMVLLDRCPETYISPPDIVSGVAANQASSVPSARVAQTTTLVSGGYELHVWSVGDTNSGASGADIWYSVRNATTGAPVVGGQQLIASGTHGGIDVPKLTLVGGLAVLTYSSNSGGDANIYARVLDMNAPAGPWSAESRINVTPGDAAFAPANYLTASYAVCVSTGEGGVMALVYESSSSSKTIVTVRLVVGASSVTIASSGNVSAAGWAADTKPNIQGFAIAADFTSGELAVAYSYTTAAPATRVTWSVAAWPSMSTIVAPVDMLTTPGPITASAINAALIISMKRLGTLGANASCYKVNWSPGQTTWNAGDAATAYPFVASYIVGNNGSGSGVVLGNQPRVTWNAALASDILALNGIGYCLVFIPSQTQGSFFILADDAWTDTGTTNASGGFTKGYFPMRLVGNVGPRQSNVQTFTSSTMGVGQAQFSRVAVPFAANPNARGGLVYQTLVPKDTSPITSAPALYQVDFASPRSYAAAELGGNVFLAGGCPSCFDGEQVFELGFPVYPVMKLVGQGTGGGATAGTYSYIAVYRWIDAAGQVHQSARSVPQSFTVTNQDGINAVVGIPGFSARMKATNASSAAGLAGTGPQLGLPRRRYIQVVLYRTINGGTVYYQVAPPAVVSLAAAAVTINDAWIADVTLQTQPELYGDGSGKGAGGNMDDECPPAWQHVVTHQNRVFGIDGNRVWSTKAFTDLEGSGVNEQTLFSVDDGPGPIVGAASMDDKLVLFKRDRVLYVTGLGPEDNGASNDWSAPTRITDDMGAVDWRGIVVTPDGCWYISDEGLSILTRDLQPSQRTNVEDLLDANPFVTSAVIHPSRNRVLWTANEDDITSPRTGITLDRDYVLDTWMSGVASVGAISATIANVPTSVGGSPDASPTYHWLGVDGQVYRESQTGWRDGSVYVPMTVETAWIKAEGLAGFARFRRLQVTWQNGDAHQLTVYVAYDFGASYTLLGTVTATQMAAMVTPLCEENFPLPRRRAQAIRFKLVDAADGTIAPTTGQGPILLSLDLEWTQYTNRRLARLPAAQRM